MRKILKAMYTTLDVIFTTIALVVAYNNIQPNQNILDSSIWYLYFIIVILGIFPIIIVTWTSSDLKSYQIIYFSLTMCLWLFIFLRYMMIYPLVQTPDNFLRGESAELILNGYSPDTVLYGVYPGHLFVSGLMGTILDERTLSSIVHYSALFVEIVTIFLLVSAIEKYFKLPLGQVIFISMGFVVTATYYSPQYTGFLIFLLSYLSLMRYLDSRDDRFVLLTFLSYSALTVTHPTTTIIGFFVIMSTYFCRHVIKNNSLPLRNRSKYRIILIMLLLTVAYTIYMSFPYVKVVLTRLVDALMFLKLSPKMLNNPLFKSSTSEIPVLLENYKVGEILFIYRLIYLLVLSLIFLVYLLFKIKTKKLHNLISTNPVFCSILAGGAGVVIAIIGIYIFVPRYWARGILFGSFFLAFVISFVIFNVQTHNRISVYRPILALSLISFFIVYPIVIPSPYTVVTFNHIQTFKFLPNNAEFVGTWDDSSIYSYYHLGNRKNAHTPQNYSSLDSWYKVYIGRDRDVVYIPLPIARDYSKYLEKRYGVKIPWKKIEIYNTIVYDKVYSNKEFFIYFVQTKS